MKKYIFLISFLIFSASAFCQLQPGNFSSLSVGTNGARYIGSKNTSIGVDSTSKVLFASIRAITAFVNERLTGLYNNIITTALTTLSASASLDFSATSAQSSSSQTIAVAGAAVGDVVALGHNVTPPTGTEFVARVTAPNFVTVVYLNPTSTTTDPDPGTFKVIVLK